MPDSVAADYLAHRGCPPPHRDGDLRWCPELRHPGGHAGPALVALVSHAVTAEALTLHRTWLRPDGGGKAAVDPPRLLWPGLPKLGGVVRLWPDAEVTTRLLVAERLETALSAAAGFGLAWSTLDAGNLRELAVLPGIEALTIVADHDAPGLAAAEACARRWRAAGREVRAWAAERPGDDFNDHLLGEIAA